MNRMRQTFILLLLCAGVVGLFAQPAGAQSGGGYDLTWNSLDNGGAMGSTAGGYELAGTIGQPDAGVLSGSGYTLDGGFWVSPSFAAYLPIVLRQ